MMSVVNRSILKYLLSRRALTYGKYVRLRRQELCFVESSLPRMILKRHFGNTAVCQKQRKAKNLSYSEEKVVAEENDNHSDSSVPLIVKLMNQSRDRKEVKGKQSVKLSVEHLQKSLEGIKWDTAASIQRSNVEEIETQDETVEAETVSEVPEMTTIEDIFLDDYVPHAQTSVPHSKTKQKIKGTPDPSVPASNIPCSGCGANLHCQDPVIPGYLPSEKFKCLTRKEMHSSMCQRCFLIQAYNMFLNVRVSADTYPQILKEIKNTKALVIVLVDLFDMKNSVFQNLLEYIGTNRPLFIVGNKVDLLPKDSKGYLARTKQTLMDLCTTTGLNPTGKNIKHICLVSAKTGYGIESLVNKLLTVWQLKGHVYVVGSTNAGKSTLFNALLMSDYCKAVARGFINRATVSVWPGTTLNLLKFPIINPTPWRLLLRLKRLKMDGKTFAAAEEVRHARLIEAGSYKASVLTGHVGQTDFRSARRIAKDQAQAERLTSGQEVVSFNVDEDGGVQELSGQHRLGRGPKGPDYKPDSYTMYWCKDTPGVINPAQIINILEPEELLTVLPRSQVQPQCAVLRPGQVLFVSGLGRVDYVQGRKSIFLTAHVAHTVPLHVLDREEADEFYLHHLGTATLGVPLGDEERLSKIPSLVGREFHITGTDWRVAAVDIQLSSLGWVSVAAGQDMPVTLRAYTPGGQGLQLRCPALLPNFTVFRGRRKGKTPFYRPERYRE